MYFARLVNDMSTRIDGLENAIQDLMHGGIDQGEAVSPSIKEKRT